MSKSSDSLAGQGLSLAFFLLLVTFFAELAGGLLSNSLSLLSDSFHVFSDVMALGVALLAFRAALKPATFEKSFGFHRFEVLAALFNGLLLMVVAVFIFFEAVNRFYHPLPVNVSQMFGVAVFGLLTNLFVVFKLRSHGNLNVHGAFLHAAGDALASVGVILGAVIIHFTGLFIVDTILSVLIALIILFSAVHLVRSSLEILLEATPRGVRLDSLVAEIRKAKGVHGVHDVHIWSICSEISYLSAHIVLKKDAKISSTACIDADVCSRLGEKFGIRHATLKFETKDYCCGKEGVCDVCH